MNNQQKLNIVMFNMSKYSDWQKGVVNRNFHVLHNLAKSSQVNKIIAVDFLPFNFKRAIKTYLKDQIIKDTRGSIVYGNLTSRCWQVTSKILVFSSVDSILNPKNILTELNKIIVKEEMQNNLIVWNYNPLYTDYLDNQLNQTLNVFDAVDDWLTHSSYARFIPTLKNNYQTIKEQSDLIFTVSKSLKEELFKDNDNTHWLPNAVDLELFQSETKITPRLNNLPSPIIGFLGILQDRIDLEILHYLAKNNPEKSIVLAGPIWKNFPKQSFEKYKNVHFLGPVPFDEIPSLYNGFDVGIIPYKVNDFIKSTDPMKFYEYLAAKLPIVSTPVEGLDRFTNLIQVAKTPEEFNHLVNQAISEDKEELSEEKLSILKSNTWQFRIKQMLDLINQKLWT
jgi:glycosyltransferase involved in cell wall biosynthesis